ncbi:MAG: phosphatase PAP2 family protein [Planctomycetaceae bacterium]|nr:phosphatase PAP2 family protein [Planctomycetaceae bacterium]
MKQAKINKINWFVFASVVFLITAAIVSYFFFDSYVSGKIFDTHRELDESFVAKLIKPLGKTYVPLWLVFVLGFLKKRIEIILIGAIALLLVLAVVSPEKMIFDRQRPNLYFANQTKSQLGEKTEKAKSYFFGLHKPLNQSFPSGDTATIFAVVAAATSFVPGFPFVVLLLAAFAVGFLRVIGLAHYPSDVLVGAALGIICGRIAILICEKWLEKNKFPLGAGWRSIAVVGIFLIPSLDVMSKGFKDLYIFSLSSVLLAGCFCLAMAIQQMLNKSTKLL